MFPISKTWLHIVDDGREAMRRTTVRWELQKNTSYIIQARTIQSNYNRIGVIPKELLYSTACAL